LTVYNSLAKYVSVQFHKFKFNKNTKART